jgi:hypothetical protein
MRVEAALRPLVSDRVKQGNSSSCFVRFSLHLQKDSSVSLNCAFCSAKFTVQMFDQVLLEEAIFFLFLQSNICLAKIILHISQKEVLVQNVNLARFEKVVIYVGLA